MRSPDAPEEARDRDALDRWPIARMIYDLVCSAPLDWPLRLGVYGKWGEGKTTVLKFLDTIAKGDGHVTTWFNPQGCHSRSELWSGFYFALSAPLGAPVGWKSALTPIRKWSIPIAKGASSIHPLVAICAGLIEPLTTHFDISQAEVAELIRTQLGNRRLFVFIDDLDRTTPDLVPDLLLSLQQLLSFPQCVFVLALDPGVIAGALPAVHPGWGPTDQFLEKFIDFPFWLPSPTREEVRSLLRLAATSGAVELNIDAVGDVLDLLPDNPRRLKLFVRRMWRLGPQLARHDPDEIDWQALYILELIRALAPRALKALVSDEHFLGALVTDLHLGRRVAERQADGSRPTEEKWRALAEQTGKALDQLEEPGLGELVGLFKAMRDRIGVFSPEKITYLEGLGDAPHIFTWKEVRGLLAEWEADGTPLRLLELVTEQARRRGASRAAAFDELFKAMILYRQQSLDHAADSIGEAAMGNHVAAAELALRLIEVIGRLDSEKLGSDHLPSETLLALYRHCAEWAHFTNHRDYETARARERVVLHVVLARARACAVDVLEAIEAWQPDGTGMEREGEVELRRGVIGELCPVVYEVLVSRFGRAGGISPLWRDDGNLVEKYYLFNPEGGLYSAGTLSALHELARRARESTAIHENFVEMVRMLGYGLGGAIGPVMGDSVKNLLRMEPVRTVLWQGATAARLQPRSLGSFRKTRTALVDAVGSEEAFPVPQWWASP